MNKNTCSKHWENPEECRCSPKADLDHSSSPGDCSDECKEKKNIIDQQPIQWSCRFHPTDWFHEVGCPHMEWTVLQLHNALEKSKKSQAYQLSLLSEQQQQERKKMREVLEKMKSDVINTMKHNLAGKCDFERINTLNEALQSLDDL